MNYKSNINFPIVDSDFIPETGFSYVTIATPIGRFSGTARVHPEDLNEGRCSRFSGQTLAHYRAFVDYLKLDKQLKMFAYQEMLRTWCTAKKKNPTSEAMKQRLAELHAEITDDRRAIQDMRGIIRDFIAGIDKYYQAKNK